jgi:hypothetical protein
VDHRVHAIHPIVVKDAVLQDKEKENPENPENPVERPLKTKMDLNALFVKNPHQATRPNPSRHKYS